MTVCHSERSEESRHFYRTTIIYCYKIIVLILLIFLGTRIRQITDGNADKTDFFIVIIIMKNPR